MVKMLSKVGLVLAFTMFMSMRAWAQEVGGVRGVVLDKEFGAPLDKARVVLAETGASALTTEQGNYVLSDVAPGTYTLIISKDGYLRYVKPDVVVAAGRLTEHDASLSGEFTEMEEFIAQDLNLSGEAGLLTLRADAPAMVDSIGSELMSRAGASDAASALKLVAGATVQDGKFAVIRGLPDRYVNSQMNGVRLPTADPDKRAVELDQFPAPVIDNIQVSKTFTPDQQGDASGGAVNVILKGIPDQPFFQFSTQTSFNTNSPGDGDFLTYKGGGVDYWGFDDGGREQPAGNPDPSVVGTSRGDAPFDHKWSLATGGKWDLNDDVRIGGFASFFYEQDSSFFDDGVEDSYWVTSPGARPTPKTSQGAPDNGDPESGDFKTSLFDVTQGSREVKWGGLGTLGIETDHHALSVAYLYTRSAEDTATLAEDTRGKKHYFPDYDVNDPDHPGNQSFQSAPYLRVETLKYTERQTQTLQFKGRHEIVVPEFGFDDTFVFLSPVLDWTVALSSSNLYEPDKRQFAEQWIPVNGGIHLPYKPQASFTIGQFQEIWKEINEESTQPFLNVKFPFRQWSGDEGYFKFGVFYDMVERTFDQDSFSNLRDETATSYNAPYRSHWSSVWAQQPHAPVADAMIDVDYFGEQEIFAWYQMVDLPLTPWFNVIGGVRFESTRLSTTLDPEPFATAIVPLADVSYSQDDVLPSIGFVFKPIETVALRGTYAETVARQTFKELTPILQQEFLGGDVFIGNPDLRMSAIKNYDLRVDYTPTEGSLFSAGYFFKDIKDPIETVQDVGDIGGSFIYTTARNYPSGTLSGFEVEARQGLGRVWDKLEGLSLGANATFIESEVVLPADEAADFRGPAIRRPMSSRDMTNAPEYLYNLYLTYDLEATGTQFGVFYTVRGDALVAGATTEKGNFIPSVYETEVANLNLTVTQKLGKHFRLTFQAKNLTDPEIQQVYRDSGGDVVKSSYTQGIDLSIGIGAKFDF